MELRIRARSWEVIEPRTRKSLEQPHAPVTSGTVTTFTPGRLGQPSSQLLRGVAWEGPEDGHGNEHGAAPEVYHSVTEAHLSPKSTDSSQLFYGPSSNFAFLQQVHRGIRSASRHDHPGRPKAQSGLDTFMQRSIFFGIPSRIDPEAIRSSSIQLTTVTKQKAKEFLGFFKNTSHYRLPFYSPDELGVLLERLYSPNDSHTIAPQTKATFLAMLAIGALSTPHTDLAETLLTEAKREVVIFDDAVTLQMLQFSILLADYQVNMGRPNSTYLHLGMACRKVFALGLHMEALAARLNDATVQMHRTTLWLLYFYETCQALTLGRRSAMRFRDIACPLPNGRPAVLKLCCVAQIMEDTADSIYVKRADSLRKVYVTAEKLHGRLRLFSETYGIASAHVARPEDAEEAAHVLTLHNIYFHAVLLIFRPFLVANYAMRAKGEWRDTNEMWLRQACRYAVDAAQDSLVFANNLLKSDGMSGVCQRYQAFFIECSCAVLLYDILCQPSKYTYNREYIEKGMQTLDYMVADEPVTTALISIRRVLRMIENSIPNHIPGVSPPTNLQPSGDGAPPHHHPSIQFPSPNHSLINDAEQMIFLTDGAGPLSDSTPAPDGDGTSQDPDWIAYWPGRQQLVNYDPDYIEIGVPAPFNKVNEWSYLMMETAVRKLAAL
ncbi:hypothetical protein S40288_09713 [Stachybotrys chartarum IBT 40288]|nr:hypothetical protein S40288_09713 [Stachybotrys chartarum IBT 40288]